jgi:hypothetical protein
MQSTERKGTPLGCYGHFLTVPDEIIAGGLSIRFAPTIRIRKAVEVVYSFFGSFLARPLAGLLLLVSCSSLLSAAVFFPSLLTHLCR